MQRSSERGRELRHILVVMIGLAVVRPPPADAQSVPEVVGAGALGVAASVPVVMGVATLRARAGVYAFNELDMLRQFGAISLTLGAAGAVGAIVRADEFSLGRATLDVAAGTVLGALVGRAIAQVTSDSQVGRWSGVSIGMGVGALAGGLVGWLHRADSDTGTGGVPLAVSVRF